MNLPQTLAHRGAIQATGPGAYALPGESVIFGTSEWMRSLRVTLEAVANSTLPVLIEGESGTGKIMIARVLHQWSPVATGTFVQVSCPAIPGTLLESELFGYEKSSPNGEGHKHGDPLIAPEGGTLCLDQIGELAPALQAKLLQLLQNGKFCPIGWRQRSEGDIRVVFATNRELETEVESGTFRRDLFYRINVVKLRLPSLRERAIDLPVLCDYFLGLYKREFNCDAKPLSSSLITKLQRYHWPGNIRQLENLMKRYVVLGTEEVFKEEIDGKKSSSSSPIEMLPEGSMSLPDASREMRRNFERNLILKALEVNQWNRRRAARALNISYRALLYKLKESQFEIPSTD